MYEKLILNSIKLGDKIGGPTELAKILTKSLKKSNGFDKVDLIHRYKEWWNSGAFDTGPTFAMVFKRISEGTPPEKAALLVHKELNKETAGCGPAHRIAPLAGFMKIPKSKLIKFAREEAKITHFHPYAGDCAAVVTMLCRYLLEGKSWEQSKNLVSNHNALKSIWNMITKAKLNNGGFVLDVMHSAIHFLDNEDSLNKSLKFAGSANYCSVIVGLIHGIIYK